MGWKYSRQHWKIRAEKIEWQNKILGELQKFYSYMFQWETDQRRKITIVSYRSRYLDEDNLKGGCKYLVDAMARIKILKNDSRKWADVTYIQKLDRENQRTEITIFDPERKENKNESAKRKRKNSSAKNA